MPAQDPRAASLGELNVTMRADRWVHSVEVRTADGASPVKSAEGDRREDECECQRVGHLLRQPGERRGACGSDTKHNKNDRDRQLPSAERAVGAQHIGMLRGGAFRPEGGSAKRGREQSATEEREVALDPGDPDEPRDPSDRETQLLQKQRKVVRSVKARGEKDSANEHPAGALLEVVT